jgi:hypothetical protein
LVSWIEYQYACGARDPGEIAMLGFQLDFRGYDSGLDCGGLRRIQALSKCDSLGIARTQLNQLFGISDRRLDISPVPLEWD